MQAKKAGISSEEEKIESNVSSQVGGK